VNNKIRMLVVDDDRRMVKTICDILNINGYEAEQAYSGEEAVLKVKSDEPGCVLMDLKMPGINGIETLKILAELAPHLPVVLMSAYATEEQVENAKREGAYTVLAKPLDLQLILSFLSLLNKEESILIVDDDPLFSRTLKDILEERGYRVDTEIDPEMVLGRMEQNYNRWFSWTSSSATRTGSIPSRKSVRSIQQNPWCWSPAMAERWRPA
jgi:two-component system, NtrC family, response regulator HydG